MDQTIIITIKDCGGRGGDLPVKEEPGARRELWEYLSLREGSQLEFAGWISDSISGLDFWDLELQAGVTYRW